MPEPFAPGEARKIKSTNNLYKKPGGYKLQEPKRGKRCRKTKRRDHGTSIIQHS